MAEDVLSLVKSAEMEADKLVFDAKKEASEILKSSKATAEDSYNEIVRDAKSKALEILERAKSSAEENKKPIISQAESKSLEIKNQDDEKINQIIDSLIERIVEDGNS